MKIKDIIEKFEIMHDPTSIEGMKKGGINPERAYGIKIPVLRKMAKNIKKNRELAQELWELGYRETMILAGMIDDPAQVTEKQMDDWISSPFFSYWEIVDQTCMNLFYLTENAYKKAVEWSSREGEFEKRASFALMAVLAWKDKTAHNSSFEDFLPIIKKEATDNRNNVKKAVNWALRQIGKRNLYLNSKALETAKEILEIDSRSSKWIARDAIKELESEAIQRRLKQQ